MISTTEDKKVQSTKSGRGRKKGIKPEKNYLCNIFACWKKGNKELCCFYCENKRECKSACMNNPEACGQMYVSTGEEKEENEN